VRSTFSPLLLPALAPLRRECTETSRGSDLPKTPYNRELIIQYVTDASDVLTVRSYPSRGVMKRLVEFPFESGGSIMVEVSIDESQEGGIIPAARPGEIAVKAVSSFEDALEYIKPAAGVIIAKLRGLSDRPDEIEVKFGLKLSAEAGAFIAAAGVVANYTITLKWKARSGIAEP
jgi:Trypsin-co-occurring domain 1